MRLSGRPVKAALALFAAFCLGVTQAPPATAEFGPIQLVSKSFKEQAGFAREAAISGDGRFVVFGGELGGQTGIFRKNLVTGAVATVLTGAAEAPSISADGRFVSLTTTQSLEPSADTGALSQDVYVADLAGPVPTYALASEAGGQRMPGSSLSVPRVALSADGSEVAFVNAGEVYVRRLSEPGPVLISATRDPATGAMTTQPVLGGGAFRQSGAALSADGSTVAWVGEHLREQVPLLPAEEQKIRAIEERPGSENERGNRYLEPLWRLVPVGAGPAPTRRIIGGGDPLAPGCGGGSAEAACQGPFPNLAEDHGSRGANIREVEGFGWGVNLPQLSADGRLVATIGSPEDDNDLFLVDMSPGLSRLQAVHRLTRWTNPGPTEANPETVFEKAEYLRFTGPVKQCAISPDGTRIAFTTERQKFNLSPPTLLTAPPTAFPALAELYQVNLQGQTIERITPGPGTGVSAIVGDGAELGRAEEIANAKFGEATLGASGPSYSDDDRTIAFGSKAINLISGDGNENSDIFTVESKPPSPVERSTISPPPSSLSVVPSWRLTVHAVSRPDGAIRIVAGVPGSGTLWAGAKSPIGAKPRVRKVSKGKKQAGSAGVLRLELTLPRRLRKLAHRSGGLYAALNVRFIGAGGEPLKQQLVARFRAHKKSSGKKGGRG